MKRNLRSALALCALTFVCSSAFGQYWHLVGDSLTSTSIFGSRNGYPLRFYTFNKERMRLDTAGRLGIFTTNPQAALDVNANSAYQVARFNTNYDKIYLSFYKSNIAKGYIGSYGGKTNDVDFGTISGNNTGFTHLTIKSVPKLTVDTLGRIGIGTTTPAALLDVTTATDQQVGRFNSSQAKMYVGLYKSGVQKGYLGSFGGATNDVDFGTASTNTTGYTHLTIKGVPKLSVDTGGRVGIGTTAPQALLDVNANTGYQVARFNNNMGKIYVGFYKSNNLKGYAGSYGGAVNDVDFGTVSTNASGKTHLTTKSIPRLTVDTAGRVGIGTTSPASSAILDLTSTNKGFLPPRMTAAQKRGVSSPVTGMMIYQTDSIPGLYTYNGVWSAVTTLVPGGVDGSGNVTFGYTNLHRINNNTGTIRSYGGNILIGNDIMTDPSPNDPWAPLTVNTDGNVSSNIVLGNGSMTHNVSGSYNIAIGHNALPSNKVGGGNIVMGYNTLGASANGDGNIAIGDNTISSSIWPGYNVAIGNGAGPFDNNISQNDGSTWYSTFIGNNATSTYPPDGATYSVAIGCDAKVSGPYQVMLGNTYITSIGGYANWTNFSDGRYKKNMKENVPGLEFINKLKPLTYNLDVEGIEYAKNKNLRKLSASKSQRSIDNSSNDKRAVQIESAAKQNKSKIIYTGFVAQDVEKAAKDLNFDFSGVDAPKTKDGFYGLRYGDFVVPLVKAVQELSKENDSLKQQVADLNLKAQKVDELEMRLKKLEAMISGGQLGSNTSVDLSGALLEQNAPNPYSATTIIRYHVPMSSGLARLVITDVKGSLIKAVNLNKGNGQITLDGGSLAAGTYAYSLWIDNKQVDTKQMVIMK